MTNKTLRVYVEMFGGYWSFNRSQWLKYVSHIVNMGRSHYEDNGFSLVGYKELRSRPEPVRIDKSGEKVSYYSYDPKVRVVSPTDWEFHEWVAELDDIK